MCVRAYLKKWGPTYQSLLEVSKATVGVAQSPVGPLLVSWRLGFHRNGQVLLMTLDCLLRIAKGIVAVTQAAIGTAFVQESAATVSQLFA